MKRILPILLLLIVFFVWFTLKANATLSGCSASVNPDSINTDSSQQLGFTITNNDSTGSMQWIKITSPSGSYSIINYNSGGYSASLSNSDFSVWGFSTGPGSSIGFTITAAAGSSPEGSSDWSVQASDNPDGSNAITCTGSLSTSIVTPVAPLTSILDITISNVTSSSVKISWTTDGPSDSTIDYGTDTGYGLTASDPASTTAHAITLSSLSSSSTYHFMLTGVDGLGNTVSSSDNTFATSAPGTTITTVTTITNTKTVTPTPTPTPLPDKNPPSVSVVTDLGKPFTKSPLIIGTAKDDKGIAKVEYSLDGGKNFLPVDKVTNSGKVSTLVNFSFTPANLDDGNYNVIVRVTDTNGNEGKSKVLTLVIDRLPPLASGFLFSFGPQILNTQNGMINVLVGIPINITLSTVGGPIEAEISAKNFNTNETVNFQLTKNSESGLWKSPIKFTKKGKYSLTYIAKDGAGNSISQSINNIVVNSSGVVSSAVDKKPVKGKISVYYQEPTTHSWVLWDASPYSQNNPVLIDANGNYNLFLPAGRYYLHIEGEGYKSANSSFFELEQASAINANFLLKPLKLLFKLGPIKWYLPDFSAASVELKNSIVEKNSVNPMVGKSIPYFKLDNISSDSLLGKPAIVTFINTWNPAASEQIAVLNTISKDKKYNTLVVVEGEKSSRVSVWKKIGGYSLPIVTDVDATLIPVYNLNSLPASFFVDKKGFIVRVVGGSLTVSEVNKILGSIDK